MLGLLWAAACGSTDMQIVSDVRGDITVELVGKKSVSVRGDWGRGSMTAKFKAGDKLVTKQGEQVIEEITLTAEHQKKNLAYNVKGLGEFYLVEYTKAYKPDDQPNAPPPDMPLQVIASLENKPLTPVPGGVLVGYTDALPAKALKGQRVFRIESVPRSLATHGVDDYLLRHLENDLKMNSFLYKK